MSRFPPRRPGRWLALAAFAGLSALFLWRLWSPNPADRMMIGPADGDFMRQVYPYRAFVARAWGSAQPPLWNPHQYAGTPAWADPQQAVLYPFRLLQAPLALAGWTLPPWAVEVEALVHLALGAWFAYLLARRLGAQALAAAFSGIAFGFGGYLTGYPVEQLAVLDTAVWVPATLFALAVAMGAGRSDHPTAGPPGAAPAAPPPTWRSTSPILALLPAACTALAILAGHPQTALYAVWAGGLWLLWQVLFERFPWRRGLVVAAVWLAGALGLSAAQWLPSAAFAASAARTLDPAEIAAGFAPRELIGLVVPVFARVWRPDAVWGSQWVPLYAGALALPLAAWGAWRVRSTRFWVLLSALALGIGMGGHNPLFPALVRLLPGMAWFRHQERVAVLVSLGLAVAAGLALERILAGGAGDRAASGTGGAGDRAASGTGDRTGSREAAVFAGALAGLTALAGALTTVRPWAPEARILDLDPAAVASALAFTALVAGIGAGLLALHAGGRLAPRSLGFAFVLLALFDLFSVNRGNALMPYQVVFGGGEIAEALAPRARDGRVASEGLLPGGPNAASVYGYYDTTGDSPLQLGSTARLVRGTPEIVWWRLLAVRYALTDRPVEGAPVREIARADQAALYEVQLPAPPAWVPARTVCPDPEDQWRRPDFNPLEAVGFAYSSAAEAAACDDAQPPLAGATAHLTALNLGRAVVEASLPAEGWLVWSNAYDRGWRARARAADGRALAPEVVPAYGALTAVRLPAGVWTVEWTYRPNTIIVGCVLSLFTLCLGLVLWRRSRPLRP